ncbi:MAG: CHASE3 domain-containing protein, partial [Runella zeae]
ENIISYLKDAETGQRGYLLTLNPTFLAPYNGAYEKATESYERAKKLTVDDSFQQNNLEETRRLYEAKFEQMQKIIDMARRGNVSRGDTTQRLAEMVKGRKIMDDLRRVVNRIKAQETKRLQERTEQLQVYIRYTPLLLAIAAIISILITVFTYIRIKRDLDERIAQQKLAEEKYIETSQRISRME